MLVLSINFSRYPSSPTLIFLHGHRLLFNAVSMKPVIITGTLLDVVGNIQRIIVFLNTIVSIDMKPQIKVKW